MKKQIITLGLMLAATFTLTNCDKISENDQIAKNNFTVFASLEQETKTTNDGYTSSWKANDAINVIHAVAGTATYVKDEKFTIAEEDVATGRFTGELAEALDNSKSYDWYMLYPHSGKFDSPVNADKCYFYIGCGAAQSQKQKGNDNMNHLSGYDIPLYATIKNLPAASIPEVTMHHLSSAVAVKVTNKSGSEMTVQSIEFTSTESIVGTYYIDIAGTPKYTDSGESYVSSTAKLSVSEGEAIKNGKSAKFYMAIKPHTVKKGGKMSIKVTATDGSVYENEISASSAATFEPGKIQTINVNYVAGSTPTLEYVTVSELRGQEKEANATNGKVNIKGVTVMALGSSSYYVADKTGGMFVYMAPGDLNIGDVVDLTDVTTQKYYKVRQITAATVTKKGTSTVSYPTAKTLDAAGFDAVAAAFPDVCGEYCTFTATYKINGSYHNLTVDGAGTMGSIVAPAADCSSFDGKKVTVTGYTLYVSGSTTKYLYFIATDMK